MVTELRLWEGLWDVEVGRHGAGPSHVHVHWAHVADLCLCLSLSGSVSPGASGKRMETKEQEKS